MSFLTTLLHPSFDKKGFSCGKPMLDHYLHTQASQDLKRKLCAVFVLPDENTIKGYYTLSSSGIPSVLAPDAIRRKMPPSYAQLPTTLLGRLAVDQRFRGQGLGELLLLDALKRSHQISSSEIGSMAVVVDPLDADATRFYAKYGFIELPDSGKMFLPMTVIGKLFE